MQKNQSVMNGSSTPEPQTGSGTPRHRRGYQACDPCRERKVKCDTGNVDNPEEGPCARCRRERIRCYFAPTRKRPKQNEPPEEFSQQSDTIKRRRTTGNDTQDSDTRIQHNPAQTRPGAYPTSSYKGQDWQPNSYSIPSPDDVRLSTNGAVPDIHDPRSTQANGTGSKKRHGANGDVQVHSKMARHVLGAPVTSTQDNIMLLVEAATNAMPEDSSPNYDSPHSERAARARAISAAMAGGPPEGNEVGLTPQERVEKEQAIRAWSRMRFVRAGWFTAKEAIQYVEFFYDRLAPMTPVVTPDFRSHTRQLALLTEEPVLALTILAISSRHKLLSGHAAMTRAYHIHDKLWTYLRYTIERLLWGQEQFGGGFCGGGASTEIHQLASGQLTWKGSLRTLGTVEALLLLTDWLPRALHFPLSDSEHRLIAPDPVKEAAAIEQAGFDVDSTASDGNQNKPYASWLEPNWRSDRMSWMLLGIAQALAFELGVLTADQKDAPNAVTDPDYKRKQRLRRLVIIHVAQTSGRIGIASALSSSDWSADFFDPATFSKPPSPTDDATDVMQHCWFHIASIMNQANRSMFVSRQQTRDLIASGRYKQSIAEVMLLMQQWKQKFDKTCHVMQPMMRNILRMEYEYARLYINSLGLQHVVESWVEHGSNMTMSAMVKILDTNKPYIDEVSDAALNILSTVVHGLASKGYLRDAPVRTFHRAISGMMFTLKRLSLGNHEDTVRYSLNLLMQVTEAMEKEVVDDVHLSSATARLVQNLTRYVKNSLIRVQKPNASGVQSQTQSRGQSPNQAESGSGQQSLNSGPTHGNHNFNLLDPELYSFDPLAEIQARPMADFSSQTFVPPPSFNPLLSEMDAGLGDHGQLDTSAFDNTDWFALPLDNLWDNSAATVDRGFGGTGPIVGTRDMLEVITNRDYNEMHLNSALPPFGGFTGM